MTCASTNEIFFSITLPSNWIFMLTYITRTTVWKIVGCIELNSTLVYDIFQSIGNLNLRLQETVTCVEFKVTSWFGVNDPSSKWNCLFRSLSQDVVFVESILWRPGYYRSNFFRTSKIVHGSSNRLRSEFRQPIRTLFDGFISVDCKNMLVKFGVFCGLWYWKFKLYLEEMIRNDSRVQLNLDTSSKTNWWM